MFKEATSIININYKDRDKMTFSLRFDFQNYIELFSQFEVNPGFKA